MLVCQLVGYIRQMFYCPVMVKAILNSSIEIVQNVGPEVKSRVPPTATAASNRPFRIAGLREKQTEKVNKTWKKKTQASTSW